MVPSNRAARVCGSVVVRSWAALTHADPRCGDSWRANAICAPIADPIRSVGWFRAANSAPRSMANSAVATACLAETADANNVNASINDNVATPAEHPSISRSEPASSRWVPAGSIAARHANTCSVVSSGNSATVGVAVIESIMCSITHHQAA